MNSNSLTQYHATYELRGDVLFLVEFDRTYQEIMLLDTDRTGLDILEYPSLHYIRHRLLDIVSLGNGEYSFVNDQDDKFWSMRMNVQGNIIKSVGTLCTDYSQIRMHIPQLPALNYFNESSVCFTCRKVDNYYQIISENNDYLPDFPVHAGQNVSEFFEKYCVFHKSSKIFDLYNNNSTSPLFFLEHIAYGTKQYYALCVLVKISDYPQREFLTIISTIPRSRFYLLSQSDHYFKYISQIQKTAYCWYDLTENEIRQCNNMFRIYFPDNQPDKLKKLVECKAAQTAIKLDKLRCEMLELALIDDIPEYFDCLFMPTYPGNTLLIVIAHNDQVLQSIEYAADKLTVREYELVGMALKGASCRSIANCLKISEGTVKKTLAGAYKKLKVTSKHDLLAVIFKQYIGAIDDV